MKSVFLVEDEAIVALELQDQLERLGFEVCGHAARAGAALSEIPTLRPDLVLMDINLGRGMTGIDVAERLRGVIDVPVVFVTAYSDPDLTRRAARTEAFAYVVKPFIPDVLRATIEMVLLRHESERRLREAHQALHESRECYRRLFEEAIEGIFQTRPDGKILAANPACARMFGYDSPEEIVGTSAEALYVVAEDRQRLLRLFAENGRIEGFELRMRKKSGERIIAEVFARRLRAPGGESEIFQGMLRDVTEQVQHRAALEVLSTGLALLTGEAFYQEVAAQLAAIVDAEVGFVSVFLPGDPPRVRTLGLVIDGKEIPGAEYEIAGTPCAHVDARRPAVFPENVRQLFPHARLAAEFGAEAYIASPVIDSTGRLVGCVGVLARKPLSHAERVLSVTRLFALRVTAEFERAEAGGGDVGAVPAGPVTPVRSPASAPLRVSALSLRFTVSRDEEYVELRAVHPGGSIDLKARAHHYLLLLLARVRLEARALPADEQGWIHQDALLRLLRADANRLYLDIYRVRRQLAEAGVEDATNIVERRPGTRQLRLGVASIEITELAMAGTR